MLLAADSPVIALLAGLAALGSAIAGCMAAYAAVVKARREGHAEGKTQADSDCEERLAQARSEAEDIADELHRLRMRKARDR